MSSNCKVNFEHLRKEHEIKIDNPVFYISKDDKVVINIKGVSYDLDCNFSIFKSEDTLFYETRNRDYNSFTSKISLDIQRKDLDDEVSRFISSLFSNRYKPFTFVVFDEEHKLKNCFADEEIYTFENLIASAGCFDYSYAIYLESDEL